MNGVRRLLGGGTPTTTSPPQLQPDSLPPLSAQVVPLSFTPKSATGPTWPPSSPIGSPSSSYSPQAESSPIASTASLFFSKKKPPAALAVTDELNNSSPYSTPGRQSTPASKSQVNYATPSPTRSQTMPSSPAASLSSSRFSARKSVGTDTTGWKRVSGNLNTRDELLMSLMASEAVIDSRDFEILSAEEVEDLKKEEQVLTSRLGAMNKKLALETKIRDAAISLSKVNASHKKVSKQTSEQLDAANKRVESAQKELWKVSDRVNEVQKRLMEHRAGVLSFSVRNMEKKMSVHHEDSGYDSSNRSTLMSPATSSMTGISGSSKSRFDGAHLFAGHADTVVPKAKLSSEAAATEISKLEEKLKSARDQLTAAGRKQAEMARELSLMKLEKQEVETMMGMDLQAAEETIAALEKEIPRLEDLNSEMQLLRHEKSEWESERVELIQRGRQVEALQTRLADLETQTGAAAGAEQMLQDIRQSSQRKLEEKDTEIDRLTSDWEAERAQWEQERQQLEDEKMDDLARLHDEMDRMREEDDRAGQGANEELSAGLSALQSMIKTHGIVLFSRDSSLQGLLNAIGLHVETVHKKLESYARAEVEWDNMRRKLEDDVRSGLDKRESLARELEDARRDRDTARRDTLTMESRVRVASHLRTPSIPLSAFPSEEIGDLDVARVIAVLQPLWAVLPSPEARAAKFTSTANRSVRTSSGSTPGSSNGVATSLSDLDVRSLKSLYDSRQQNAPGTPASPKVGSGPFTIEAFAQRVQALINDDKALIERLVRFAQAHDLLKKNAERAQKLAQDGNTALETYQKQVRILEERNMSTASKQSAMQEELLLLHETIERLSAEKRELEMLAAEQGETCRQLTEANNTLSGQTLALADEAAKGSEMVRKQLEAQLAECRKSLKSAQDEIERIQESGQSQQIALMTELDLMQTENDKLRGQLSKR